MSRARWIALAIGSLMIATAASTVPATAYTAQTGSRDHALLNYQSPDDEVFVYLNATAWGTGYYGGIPPEPIGGLGDLEVCFQFFVASHSNSHGCHTTASMTFDRLNSMHLEATFLVAITTDDEPSGSEPVEIDITLTGRGLPYPGATAQSDPSPGARATISFLRDAVVVGTISSPTIGTIDLSPGNAVLGHDDCYGILLGTDDAQACRF